METFATSSAAYQSLDQLYYSLTEVLPKACNKLSYCYILKAMILETSNIYEKIRNLKIKWQEQLPFDEDNVKKLQWNRWSVNFHPGNIQNLMRLRLEVKESMGNDTVEDMDVWLVDQKDVMFDRLLAILRDLSDTLMEIETILNILDPDKVKDLYYKRKSVYENNYSRMRQKPTTSMLKYKVYFFSETYYKKMLESFFISADIKEDDREIYWEKLQQEWEKLLDENKEPNILEIGMRIFNNRYRLKDSDLQPLFDYICFQEDYTELTKELNKIEISKQVELKNSNLIFVEEYNSKKVNLQLLYEIIQNECLPKIQTNYHWFCLWRVLKDLKLVIKKMTQKAFLSQMKKWYESKPCTYEALHIYAPTHLGQEEWRKWDFERYKKSIDNKPRANIESFEEFRCICRDMERALMKFCKNPDGERG